MSSETSGSNDVIVESYGKRHVLAREIVAGNKYLASVNPRNDGILELFFSDPVVGANEVEQAFSYIQRGSVDPKEKKSNLEHVGGMISIARTLGVHAMEQDYVDIVKASLTPLNAASTLTFFIANSYGTSSGTICQESSQFLKYLGTDMMWDTISELPSEVIRNIMASDSFYAKDEYHRVQFLATMYDMAIRHGNTSIMEDLQYVLNENVYFMNMSREQIYKLSLLRDVSEQVPLIKTEELLKALEFKYNDDYREPLRLAWRRGDAVNKYFWWSDNCFALDGRQQEFRRIDLDEICPDANNTGCFINCCRRDKSSDGDFVHFKRLEALSTCQPGLEEDARHETGQQYKSVDYHMFTMGEETSGKLSWTEPLSFSKIGSDKVILTLNPPALSAGLYKRKK